MIGFDTVATTTGLVIGIICGFAPLGLAVYYKQYRPGILGFIACALSGFACGFLGGLPMIVLSTAVVFSHAYVNRQDPFTSRASIDEVDFEESNTEFFIRQMAGLGRTIRVSIRALVRNKAGFLGFLGLAFFFAMTAFGPLFIEYDGEAHYADRMQEGARSLYRSPSREFPLGLDWQGRDVLSHIVYGGKNLITLSVEAGVLTTIIAVVLGASAALAGGIIDQMLSAASNFILAVPRLPLLLVLASLNIFGNNTALVLLFAMLQWPTLMRAVRAQVLSLRERDYIEVAFALDLGVFHIIMREVLPNMISYIVINMIFSIRFAVYLLVALVFLGMVPLQEPDWGIMIYFGRTKGAIFNPSAVSMLLSPIIAIALFQLSLVMFTRSLEEIFNPRLRAGL